MYELNNGENFEDELVRVAKDIAKNVRKKDNIKISLLTKGNVWIDKLFLNVDQIKPNIKIISETATVMYENNKYSLKNAVVEKVTIYGHYEVS